ncbi:MAG TPA: DUF1540 domain-containing protein [Bacillota bacterium]
MASDVKCEVSSCHYWGQGNRCEARAISVVNAVAGGANMEAGTIGHEAQARTTDETACKTFKPRSY